MSGRDYNKHVLKRQKIKKRTLVVGLDIGKEFNAMSFMNKAGEVLGRYPKIYNSRQGFEYFRKVIEETKKRYGLKEVFIGMEPTGHYWRKIAFYAKDQGYEVRFIRTTALKHQREVDESSSAKSDIKDSLTIANITREGKYIDTVIEEGLLNQLRILSKTRERLQRENGAAQQRLGAVLDDYFPELRKIFWSVKAKGLQALLGVCPFPNDVLELSIKEIGEVIARSSRRKAEALEKASLIYKAAGKSIGLKDVGIGDKNRLEMALEDIRRSSVNLKDIEKQMETLLKQIPYAEIVRSIPGVGLLTTAMFLGELGNPGYFKGAKQIVKYAGYDPEESDSGMKIGRRKISKKGRWLLRKCLYFMGMQVIHRSEFFKKYYKKKLENRNLFGQPLKKKEALCAVIIKLIKVIFALLRDNRKFSTVRPGFG